MRFGPGPTGRACFPAGRRTAGVVHTLNRWVVGLVATVGVTIPAHGFLVTDPFLLSVLAVAWFAAAVAVYEQRGALGLFGPGNRWSGAFAAVTTYVSVVLLGSVGLPPDEAFVVSLTALALAAFGLGAGSAMTARRAGVA
jgi:hypothetical protein